mmetsp:Transcript_21166/g.30970  ORF Transcript_21166/g.30970 Transcript_21166/m.30970 type:complete len:133 (+) Transcript_21166:651-1049(+)
MDPVPRRSLCCFNCLREETESSPSASADDVMISSTVRGTKFTTLPSSVPIWRTDWAALGIWFVQIEALIHSVRSPVTRSNPMLSAVDDDGLEGAADPGVNVNALVEAIRLADAMIESNADEEVLMLQLILSG